jgi:alginate O-acetyltransferase complex protein AlgI
MLFHSFSFLIFFIVVFTVYWSLRAHRSRMVWLLGASCFFYMSWKPLFILLILFSASVDFVTAQMMESTASARRRKVLLILSISINLSLLAFFKYMNFFLDSVYTLVGWFGSSGQRSALDLLLPLGISFYTFETISYIVDVYMGRTRAERNLLDYALYILFFPHLIAGPIVRPRDFLPQLRCPKRFSWTRCYLGIRLFLLGLFKKAILADHLARVVDPVFAAPAAYSSAMTWLAVLGYSLQIYCDFSGYSGMAVGLAHMLGFKLPANFNLPYLAANITEFWRRWHISLSSWLRDYLYIPLGGNRNGTLATYRNLILTMLLGGLWHGANWTFVAWGLYHGVLLAIHRMMPKLSGRPERLFRPVAITCTFLLVCVGWVFFRAQSFGDAWTILTHMAQPIAGAALSRELIVIGLACLIALALGHILAGVRTWERLERWLPAPALGASLATLLLLTQLLFPLDTRAFIYFQF